MRAEQAGKLVAKHIGKRWPADKADVYETLRLGVNKAHKEGKWRGMTKEYFVPKRCDKDGQFIIAPYENPILLAVNLECQTPGTSIYGKNFLFHKNGNGSILSYPGCRWNQNVLDLGDVPIIGSEKININSGVVIGVRAIGTPGTGEKVYINGAYSDGRKVFTYKNTLAALSACKCSPIANTVETNSGIEIDITSDFTYICNIDFTEIFSIHKTITRTPIEVIAIQKNNYAQPIAMLYPNQTTSRYRKYRVPTDCSTCVHGLFKIRQQEEIISDNEDLIIQDEEALIGLAKAIDYIYRKEQPDTGALYFAGAIASLDKEKAEEESPESFPIQMQPTLDGDMPEIFKYVS